ncbi:cell wall protein DAN4-like [Xiphophorus maculatus]|uniref:cell wall protein DAN4-like n=1 Tax=Xiphophorus maculatus TaxID=8083 RepID=UPI000C6E2AB9|nr:cell wall protein DAN4-like [Xiphophorus maculatus]
MLSSVLLLLLISGAQAAYYGAVLSYYFGDVQPFVIPYHFKESGSSCQEVDIWHCGGNCTTPPVYAIDESRNEWCQKTRVDIYNSYGPNTFTYQHSVGSSSWIENRNGIVQTRVVVNNDLRNRSDINKPNSTPQTTIIPLVRVPSNCQRNINLLVSDPDGDDIRCRYAAGSECNICTPPSVLSVSSSCSLSFSPTNSSNEGPYAVQMMVEDFPRQTITLTDGNTGVQEVKTSSIAIGSIPFQFVFRVDPAAPSCTEGEYLPRFLPPTPEHGAQIFTNVNQAVEISVRAEATQADTTELLFSGPPGSAKSSSGSGNFTLTWTPIAGDGGLNYPLCFVVQANSSSSVYQSDLRCVFVTTGNTTVSHPSTTTPPQTTTTLTTTTNQPTTTTTPPQTTTTLTTTTNQPTTTTTPPTSSTPNATPDPGPNYVLALDAMISTTLLMETDSATIMNLIKEELKRQGLTSDITLKLLSSRLVGVTTPAP